MPVATDLPETILAKTREGKLPWERLSSGGYYTTIGRSTITIDYQQNSSLIFLRITNEEGLVVETFSSRDRSDTTLEDTYELARRQALRVDETLSDIKRRLDSL